MLDVIFLSFLFHSFVMSKIFLIKIHLGVDDRIEYSNGIETESTTNEDEGNWIKNSQIHNTFSNLNTF